MLKTNNIPSRWQKAPVVSIIVNHIITYPTPMNLNYLWSFGSLAGIFLVIQILTGLFLSMHYNPDTLNAFNSVEHIMRDVYYGWLLRYMHANGASFFFIVMYIHIFRGIFYGSYMYPRGKLWCSGVVLFLLTMATAFLGYTLPWGQMSLWGATVITNLLSAIPIYGQYLVEWIWGGFCVDRATLGRFYTLHFVLPFIIAGATCLHLLLLHTVGSNNPTGINKGIPMTSFYPYFFIKDLYVFWVVMFLYGCIVFFAPNMLGHPDNYIPANAMVTPPHIVPEWYFLPFYAILRSIPNKLGGVIAMFGAILVWFFLPILNTSLVRSSRFRPLFEPLFWLLAVDFLILGWIGGNPVESPFVLIGALATGFYFLFFLVLLPLIGYLETTFLFEALEDFVDAELAKDLDWLYIFKKPVAVDDPKYGEIDSTDDDETEAK